MAQIFNSGLRERKKAILRSQIVEAAIDLFVERGFRGTLVDDIAMSAGISRRTFFHYFPAKQDVIGAWFHLQGEYLAETLQGRPTNEPIWMSLRVTFLQMRNFYGRDDHRIGALQRLIHFEPVFLAKKYEFFVYAAQALVPAVNARLERSRQRSLVSHVLVQGAIGAYNAASAEWAVNSNLTSFEVIAKKAFQIAEPAILRTARQLQAHS